MPFQPINFASIAPQGDPFMKGLVKNLAEGYMASQLPAQMERQKQQEELANAMAKFNLDKAPVKFDSDMRTAEMSRLLNQTNINKTNQMMPLEMQKIQAYIHYLKNKGEGGGENDEITTARKTANQGLIQAIDNTLPMVKGLKPSDSPGRVFGQWISPNLEATYQSKLGVITDSLVSALGLPKTNESLALVKNIVGRRPGESDDNYQTRLDALVADLNDRRTRSLQELKRIPKNSESERVFNLESGDFE
jgi:hypothetical protein